MCRWLSLLLITLLSFGFLSAVSADDGDEEARQAFDEGKQHYFEKRYDEAAKAFREAYELKQSWKLFYNIGQSEVLAKHYGLALEAFENYLAQGGDEVPEDRQAETIKEIKRLQALVGTIRVDGQAGDEVVVNGRVYGTLPRARRVKEIRGTDVRCSLVDRDRCSPTLTESPDEPLTETAESIEPKVIILKRDRKK